MRRRYSQCDGARGGRATGERAGARSEDRKLITLNTQTGALEYWPIEPNGGRSRVRSPARSEFIMATKWQRTAT